MIQRLIKALGSRSSGSDRSRSSPLTHPVRTMDWTPEVDRADVRYAGLPALKVFSDRQGLPQNTILDIEFDRNGYLWVATEDGAGRYNGRNWQVVSMPHRTSSNFVRCVKAARDGSLWFGTHGGGIARRHEAGWTVYDSSNGLPDDIVISLAEQVESSGEHTIWAGTRRGLARFRRGAWTVFGEEDGLPNDVVTSLSVAGPETLWVGTRGGLARFDSQGWHAVPDIGYPSVRCLFWSETRCLWIGTAESGLLRYDGEGWDRFDTSTGLVTDHVYCIDATCRADGRRILWLGTDVGLVRFDPQTNTPFEQTVGIPGSTILSLCSGPSSDRERTLWIGTDGGGLARMMATQWVGFTARSGLPDDCVLSVAETRETQSMSQFWFGTERGLASYHRGGWKTTNDIAATIGSVTCLLSRVEGGGREALFVGTTRSGLAVLRRGEWECHDVRSGFLSDHITCLATEAGASPALWVGTDNGLARHDGSGWTFFRAGGGLPHHYVRSLCITEGSGGEPTVWVGTNGGGLARLSAGRWDVFDVASGFPNNTIPSLREIVHEGRRALWVGTQSAGVAILDIAKPSSPLAVISDETDPALPNNTVNQIQVDTRGRVYVFTNKGVTRLTRRVDAPLGSTAFAAYTFTTDDGLPSNECNNGASFVDSLGRVWAGTVGGAAMLDPAIEIDDHVPKPLHVSKTIVVGEPAPIHSGRALAHDENDVTFEFDLLSYFREADTRYRTQLVGFDAKPTGWSPEWKRTYTNLPAGRYTFNVWGRDYAGNVSGPETLEFSIQPAPWRTWWAYSGYAALVAGAAYGGVRWRLSTLRRRTEELEETVMLQTAELAAKLDLLRQSEAITRNKAEELARVVEQLRVAERNAQRARLEALSAKDKAIEASHAKSVFLSNMSHELRTPLNAVLGFAQLMDRDSGLSTDQREHLSAIMSSGEHLLHLINDVLSLSKIEAGKLTLTNQPFDLLRTIEGVEAMLRGRTRAKSLGFVVERSEDLPRWVRGDEGKLRQVLINLLGNAVKFTASGSITLRARWRGGIAEFEVKDTGHGISPDELESLFEPFVQTESGRRSKEGTGLGLAISRNFVQMMGGDIRVRSQLGMGSVFGFDIELPEVTDGDEVTGRRSVLALEPGQPEYRVLIVDDAERNREILVKLLSSVGFAVCEASDGREAVAVWTSWRPDLVLMDMRMPVLDGRSATLEIRRLEAADGGNAEGASNAPRTKVISLTASAFEHERDAILEAGCDDFLTKPFREEVLFQKLARHLNARFRYALESSDRALSGRLDSGVGLEPGRLRGLPSGWLTALNEAVVKGDIEQANRIVDDICGVDARIADDLRELIKAYRFDEIQDLIEQVPS